MTRTTYYLVKLEVEENNTFCEPEDFEDVLKDFNDANNVHMHVKWKKIEEAI